MARPAQDEKTRFQKFVAVDESGCHLWQSTLHRDGYGKFYFRGRQVQAHVAAFALFVGPVPSGAHVCHTCDVRNCVNPAHLYAGDAKSNVADMHRRGRFVGCRKLTGMQARVIRRLTSASGLSQDEIAAVLKISQTTVSRIARGTPHYLSRVAA